MIELSTKILKVLYQVISQAYWFRQNLCLKYKSCYKLMYMWLLVVVHVHAYNYNLQNIPTCLILWQCVGPQQGFPYHFQQAGKTVLNRTSFS